MDNLLTVAFEAHHAEKNHHRRYRLTLGRDLLDDWTLTVEHGRVGRPGQEQQFASAEAEPIRAMVRERLRRRLSAPRRIGCHYRLVRLDAAPGFDAAFWLPQDAMIALGCGVSADLERVEIARDTSRDAPLAGVAHPQRPGR